VSARWRTRAELEEATADYQRDWWRTDIAARAIIDDHVRHPRVRGTVAAHAASGIVTTADVYKAPTPGSPRPSYLAQRATIQAAITAQCLAPQPAPGPPVVYFTIGCPGAGKTTVLRSIVDRTRSQVQPDPPLYSIVDADRVRQQLPEYADGLGAFVVQEESFDITYGPVLDAAIDLRADIVFDTIGRLASVRDTLDRLHAERYRIHVLLARSTVDLCAERTERRALTVDGRLVNPASLRGWIADADETLAALLREDFPLAGWAIIDTADMSRPTLIDGSALWQQLLSGRSPDPPVTSPNP
jgi:predicted ATPase